MKNTVIALMFATFRNCLLRTLDPYRIRSVLAVTAMKMVKMNARRIATMSTVSLCADIMQRKAATRIISHRISRILCHRRIESRNTGTRVVKNVRVGICQIVSATRRGERLKIAATKIPNTASRRISIPRKKPAHSPTATRIIPNGRIAPSMDMPDDSLRLARTKRLPLG